MSYNTNMDMNSADVATLVPNPADLLALSVEEQGRLILKLLTRQGGKSVRVNQHNFFNRANDFASPPKYGSRQKEVDEALLEAWAWLVGRGLLAKDPGPGENWFFATKAGQELGSQEDTTAYRKANLLPKEHIHPALAEKVYAVFLRGRYDTAIFQAFLEIEVAVREAGGFPQDLVGEKLMRVAFAPAKSGQHGPLTDTSLPAGEQEAMSHLFAGAFGLYRNPTAHRYVPTDPQQAAEVIVFASQLRRIVDRLRVLTPGVAKP